MSSAQINLYHPRFLKQRELLTLRNVVLATVSVYSVLALVGGWAWQNANTKRDSAAAAEAQLKLTKDQVDAATKAAATRKPSPQLAAELESAEGMLRRREEIARLLESGAIGSTGGFSEYMRGFARQAQDGLWLTGFSIGAGGNDMEIRGSMLNPGALPITYADWGPKRSFRAGISPHCP
jgi:MSHA biogenesis protein MshI